ncbi:hypothetical protein CDL15_Pgr026389 [Punica granatum]|uniref:Uncharacterized protein n=1 Tax=Punica granatum TaxID=22663 RepID=A0A218XNE7_PUNGR|nr:hypothetical protein CDL15_Pgr026389 [Punica granatum]PKI75048.1 hypothetical protein CRG98_004522 [Punica granatum]
MGECGWGKICARVGKPSEALRSASHQKCWRWNGIGSGRGRHERESRVEAEEERRTSREAVRGTSAGMGSGRGERWF